MKIGITLASFKSDGTTPVTKEELKIISNGFEIIDFSNLRISVDILNGPTAFQNFSLEISTSISLLVVGKTKTLRD